MSETAKNEAVIRLAGRIDSNNAPQMEKDILEQLAGSGQKAVILDAAELEYISSAGLRVILRLKKTYPDLCIRNVNADVFEVLDMTGFTEIMPVEKAYREISVEGCEEIGRGANGVVYRIDQDNVVKVYWKADALEEIRHEREMAKLALVLGIPTAISYDVVRVGDGYGSVFELLNARSFSKILEEQPEKTDWCIREYVGMLKKMHSTPVPEGKLPDMRAKALSWAADLTGYLPRESEEKLLALLRAMPMDDHMIHGDFHTKNLELQGDEVLIIDMDKIAVGHPVFEWAAIYNAFIGFSEVDRENVKGFLGLDFDAAWSFWRKSLSAYLETDREEKIIEVEEKARIPAYLRLLSRSIRRKDRENETGRMEMNLWKTQLIRLLEKTDTLLF